MLCPAWTSTRMQPVAIRDVIAAIKTVADDLHFETYDLGCPEVVTYRELLEQTAETQDWNASFSACPCSLTVSIVGQFNDRRSQRPR